MVCYDLSDVFTAELAENAENTRIFVCPCGFCLCVLPPGRRPYGPEAAISSVAPANSGGELVSKQ